MAKVGPFMLKHSHLSHDRFVSQIFFLSLPIFCLCNSYSHSSLNLEHFLRLTIPHSLLDTLLDTVNNFKLFIALITVLMIYPARMCAW